MKRAEKRRRCYKVLMNKVILGCEWLRKVNNPRAKVLRRGKGRKR